MTEKLHEELRSALIRAIGDMDYFKGHIAPGVPIHGIRHGIMLDVRGVAAVLAFLGEAEGIEYFAKEAIRHAADPIIGPEGKPEQYQWAIGWLRDHPTLTLRSILDHTNVGAIQLRQAFGFPEQPLNRLPYAHTWAAWIDQAAHAYGAMLDQIKYTGKGREPDEYTPALAPLSGDEHRKLLNNEFTDALFDAAHHRISDTIRYSGREDALAQHAERMGQVPTSGTSLPRLQEQTAAQLRQRFGLNAGKGFGKTGALNAAAAAYEAEHPGERVDRPGPADTPSWVRSGRHG